MSVCTELFALVTLWKLSRMATTGEKIPFGACKPKKKSTFSKLWSLLETKPVAQNDTTQNGCPPEEQHFSEWRHMLLNYTKLELTFEKDRFPAVSGLARCFANKFKATYAAGLWVENLRNDLLWVMPHRSKPEQRRLDAGAPTWSWANCGKDTSGYSCYLGSHLYFTVVAVDCVPLSEHDPFGQLKSATLTLQGPLMPLILKLSKKGYDAQSDGLWGIDVEPDLNLAPILADANERGLFFGLPIVQGQTNIRGLVLHRQDGGTYERVGLWFCSEKDVYHRWSHLPEWWGAEKLHKILEKMEVETVVMV